MKYIKEFEIKSDKFKPGDNVYVIDTFGTILKHDRLYTIIYVTPAWEFGDYYITVVGDLTEYNYRRFISELEYNTKKYNL